MIMFSDVFEIPYDPYWELDRNCFQMMETLGEGAFGVVVRAEAVDVERDGEPHKVVAVKMLKGMLF